MSFKIGESVSVTLSGNNLGIHQIEGIIPKGTRTYIDPLSNKKINLYEVPKNNCYLLSDLKEPLENDGSTTYQVFAEKQLTKLRKIRSVKKL
jgi:hypothetical protein